MGRFQVLLFFSIPLYSSLNSRPSFLAIIPWGVKPLQNRAVKFLVWLPSPFPMRRPSSLRSPLLSTIPSLSPAMDHSGLGVYSPFIVPIPCFNSLSGLGEGGRLGYSADVQPTPKCIRDLSNETTVQLAVSLTLSAAVTESGATRSTH